MTGPGSSRITTADISQLAADDLMRSTVRHLHETVESLLRLGQEHELELPVDTLYVLGLAEHVACLTLEALQSWPNGPR